MVGTCVAGRHHAELANTVGMFVNTLAIRVNIDKTQSVQTFFHRVKEKLLKGYENQDCQFELLVERLNLKKDLSRNPLFDIMINYLSVGTGELELEGLTLNPVSIRSDISKFDLTWTIYEKDEEFFSELEYCTRLFKQETAVRIESQLLTLLEQIVGDETLCLSDLEILSPIQRNILLEGNRSSWTDFPRDKTIADLFEEQVQKTQTRTAIRFKEEALSYFELNQAANKLAWTLKGKGVNAGTMVGLVANRSLEQIIAILGILKAGGAYVPIEPDIPETRIKFILGDCGARFIVTQSQFASRFINRGDIVLVDDVAKLASDTSNPPRLTTNEDLAYVMYTSGSTGQPKGTLINQRNVIRVVRNTNYINFEESDTVLQLSNYAFDGSVFDIFGGLLNGACLLLVGKEVTIDMHKLTEVIRSQKSPVFFITSALFNMLVDVDVEGLKGVRKIIVGGDRVSVPHARRALAVIGPDRLINGYGPTESTVFATYYPINELSPDANNVPIGKPISNTTVYVLDPMQRFVADGVAGELCIGGDGLSIGYLNRADYTAEKFIENPFEPGKKMYRTGDLVRRLADGNIEFLGRMDFQVKIRGFRVEMGEIESQLQQITAIKECAVLAREGTIMAFYTAEQEGIAGDIKSSLKSKLPEYMVPAFIIQLDAMPLNANGKTDRNALLKMELSEDLRIFEPPANELEHKLAESMQKVLAVSRIGRKDDFFDLGGHSLKAIALVQLLAKQGIELRVSDVFQCATIENMAALPSIREHWSHPLRATEILDAEHYIAAKLGVQAKYVMAEFGDKSTFILLLDSDTEPFELNTCVIQGIHPNLYPAYVVTNRDKFQALAHKGNLMADEDGLIQRRKLHQEMHSGILANVLTAQRDFSSVICQCQVKKQIPLSPIQTAHLGIGSSYSGLIYNIPHPVNVEALNSTIATIVNKHELLRSVLTDTEATRSWQEHDLVAGLEVPFVDMTAYGSEDQMEMIADLSKIVFFEPYQSGVPSHRIACVQLNWARSLLLWGFDHAVFDGMSGDIIKRQFQESYSAVIAGQDLTIGHIPSYGDYVSSIIQGPRDITEEEIISTFQMEAYRETLDCFLERLPKNESKDNTQFSIAVSLSSILEDNIWNDAYRIVCATLCRYTGLTRLPLAVVSYGRSYGDSDYYECVGEFLDMVPIVSGPAADDPMRLIRLSAQRCLNFMALTLEPNLRLRFPRIADLLRIDFDKGRPLDLVLYNFQGKVMGEELQIFGASNADESRAGDEIAAFTITVHYDEDLLHIEFASHFGIDHERMSAALSQERTVLSEVLTSV